MLSSNLGFIPSRVEDLVRKMAEEIRRGIAREMLIDMLLGNTG